MEKTMFSWYLFFLIDNAGQLNLEPYNGYVFAAATGTSSHCGMTCSTEESVFAIVCLHAENTNVVVFILRQWYHGFASLSASSFLVNTSSPILLSYILNKTLKIRVLSLFCGIEYLYLQ